MSTRAHETTAGQPAAITLRIEGMSCASCVGRVEGALRRVEGVREVAVNLATGLARVEGTGAEGALVRAVARAGYRAEVLAGSAAEMVREVQRRGDQQARSVWRRLVFGVIAGGIVVGIDLALPYVAGEATGRALRAVQLVLATAVLAYTGRGFFVGAWRAGRHATMDTLVALGAGVAYAASAMGLAMAWMDTHPLAPAPPLHGGAGLAAGHGFNELHAAVMIVVLVLVGKYLEARAKRSAGSAIAGLAWETGATAVVLNQTPHAHPIPGVGQTPDTSRVVPVEDVRTGDLVQVLAHQRVPVDGVVVEGAGWVDMAVVTGESVPVEAAIGAKLPGGALLADGRVVLRATATAGDSAAARIVGLVAAAQAGKTQIQALADRVAGVFVPIVLALAVLTLIGWMVVTGDWPRALAAAIATVVIACPCAMGLATPTAIMVATGTAARLGILFTRAGALETAGGIGVVLFDKTGTLTTGQVAVAEIINTPHAHPIPGVGHTPPSSEALHPGVPLPLSQSQLRLAPPEEILQIAAALEQFSEHPLAAAIVAAARQRGLEPPTPDQFASVPGGGVQGILDGVEYAVGSLRWLATLGATGMEEQVRAMEAEGMTVVAVGRIEGRGEKGEGGERRGDAATRRRGEVLGLIGLRDTLRTEAGETIARLRSRGVKVGVVSGDTEAAVRGVLQGIQVDFLLAAVGPADKAGVVHRMAADHGRVAFVGDGINDGPALAAADLGLALATGTELAKAAGDVVLVSGRLESVPAALELSRATLRVIKQNLFWAFFYNVAAIPLAMAGVLPAGVAAGAMVISSLTVVGNAMRLCEPARPRARASRLVPEPGKPPHRLDYTPPYPR